MDVGVWVEGIGWLGSFLLAVCAFPQAWASWRQGHSNGLTWSLLILWGGGEVFTLSYVMARGDAPLILNYACNFASLAVIAFYKARPRPAISALAGGALDDLAARSQDPISD